ncbi:Phenoxybenzoate dioxygenase subunit beta [Paraburkholderia tropica]|uniref:PDR/VanB family oxidoreductase n=1 Tax=Paraburkholderia tropica TaxID=92647 RepID=UPI001CB59001|nr:PDR/VanB family oxidoreductase [Paraburkholderia tropica]CAG9193191.1 Phenoxybenzoate dioxygenase subunit beta [Paraburkholderia tropica]
MMNDSTHGAGTGTNARLQARVRTLRHEAQRIASIELVPVEGEVFPPFTPGAHLDVHLPNGLTRSYSLVNAPEDQGRYVIGVLHDEKSRGGSRWLHEELRCGATLSIGAPRNNFALDEAASSTLLVAGGIGVTPMLCMYRKLRERGRAVQFVYCARSRAQAAFLDELAALGGDVQLHFDDEHGGRPFDLAACLARQPSDVHAYCCGPGAMLDAFQSACAEAGIDNVHIERFAASAPVESAQRTGYTVELARSGRTLFVPAGKPLLDALLDADVDVEYSCREGLCGACQTRVLGGCVDHRDSVLTQSERAANDAMMICVSGAQSGTLVLDLA